MTRLGRQLSCRWPRFAPAREWLGTLCAALGGRSRAFYGPAYLADLDHNGSVNVHDYLPALQNAGHGCDGGH